MTSQACVRVGIDEVGRGCLAGPVSACAFAWRSRQAQEQALEWGLRDSKKLSAKMREALVPRLQPVGWFGHGEVPAAGVDEMGIQVATFYAMQLALQQLHACSGIPYAAMEVVIDGNVVPSWPDLGLGELRCEIKADDRVSEVSAASVLAKVQRDQAMARMDQVYQGYGFAQHAGYGTAMHLSAIDRLGPTHLHRMSFAPLNRLHGTQPKASNTAISRKGRMGP